MENKSKNKIVAKKKGVVTSDKMNKTIVVAVNVFKTHLKYRKKSKSTKKYKVHDEENKHKAGDVVEIVPSKPLSKHKKYSLA